jgi:hypothetical protein
VSCMFSVDVCHRTRTPDHNFGTGCLSGVSWGRCPIDFEHNLIPCMARQVDNLNFAFWTVIEKYLKWLNYF